MIWPFGLGNRAIKVVIFWLRNKIINISLIFDCAIQYSTPMYNEEVWAIERSIKEICHVN